MGRETLHLRAAFLSGQPTTTFPTCNPAETSISWLWSASCNEREVKPETPVKIVCLSNFEMPTQIDFDRMLDGGNRGWKAKIKLTFDWFNLLWKPNISIDNERACGNNRCWWWKPGSSREPFEIECGHAESQQRRTRMIYSGGLMNFWTQCAVSSYSVSPWTKSQIWKGLSSENTELSMV